MRRKGEVTPLGNHANEGVDQWILLQTSNCDIKLSSLFSNHPTFLETRSFHIPLLSEPNTLLLNTPLEANGKLQPPTQTHIGYAASSLPISGTQTPVLPVEVAHYG